MTDDKKPKGFDEAERAADMFLNFLKLQDEYDAILKENERLSKMLEYEKQREYPTQSQRELAYVNEITSLRESLKLAVDFLTSIEKGKCTELDCGCPSHAGKALATIKAKGGL